MAHPADTASSHGGAPAAFSGARLTPEEAERLAATFRPSWELDDAPFTGPASMTAADVQALGAGGTQAEVRAAVAGQAAPMNGSHTAAAHTPPLPTVSHEPENSVIIDRSITADQIAPSKRPSQAQVVAAPAPAPVATRSAPPAAPARQAPAGPTGTVMLPPEQAPRVRPPAAPPSARRQAMPAVSAARARIASADLDVPAFPKKSNKGLLIGVAAVAAVVVVGGLVMAVSGGSSSDKPMAPAPTTEAKTSDKTAAIPPPPPETATATAAPTPPPPATTVAASPPPPAAPVQTSPLAATPAPPPPERPHVAAAPAPRPNYGAAPAPRPAPKKGGQTIVRDVPF